MLGLAVVTLLSSFVDFDKKEINVKIVYVAATDEAAHANLDYIYAKTNPDAKSKLTHLEPMKKGSVKWFDFLPLSLGEIRGFKTRFHLYTSVTDPAFAETRKLVMKGADGVVFVADKDPKRAAANAAALKAVKADLSDQGYDWKEMVVVYQAQSDGTVAGDTAAARKSLGLDEQTPIFEAVPATGVGVFDTLKAAAKGVLMALKKGASDANVKDGGK